ncbi:cupin domain-containing protein [Saccharothrix violaceirubra]|uniref:Putative monooxygenase n=1 Tax=Saccharothrix violaceirubra TaxID=413306 RepID=A0A7W7SZU9_9PSEU|nr:cupin domain-containing protein [Saccharothrix violaceirubra]MBB4963387.1 putative monooxygenase [Saccharothrix violaceirubra]
MNAPRKINATAVEPNVRRGGEIRVTLSPRTVGACSGFGGVLDLAPGDHVTEHYHPYSEEFLHVVTGELRLWLDGDPVDLGADDSLLVPIGVRHRLVNVGTAPAHVVFHLSPLAPRPELGHVDTEAPRDESRPNVDVGGAP